MHREATSAQLVARIVPFTLLALLAVAACGAASAPSSPVTIHEADGSTVTLSKQPHRIVSLSATATEMLFAIGAGKQVIAVDDQSNYPASAPMTKLSGFQPNVEAIAGYRPDLVVAAEDNGGLVKGLSAVGVPTLIEAAASSLDQSYKQIRELGLATGHSAEADSVAGRMSSDIASAVASAGKPARRLSVYHELDDTYYSASSRSFIGQVYTMLGLKDIADGAPGPASDYPQLTSEYIVSSNPDLIVLADTKCCHQGLSTVRARPGWAGIAAVRSGEVVEADDDVASRWGPRVVDFIREVAPRVAQLGHTQGT
jgi:iron complex transport system substrate-binding protein